MTLAYTRLEVRKIGGRVGAEIIGVDLSRHLDDATIGEPNAALLAHQALFFRGHAAEPYTPKGA